MPALSRRSLITGLISLVAAPAIVRAGSLMPVKVWPIESGEEILSNGIIIRWKATYAARVVSMHWPSGELIASNTELAWAT